MPVLIGNIVHRSTFGVTNCGIQWTYGNYYGYELGVPVDRRDVDCMMCLANEDPKVPKLHDVLIP